MISFDGAVMPLIEMVTIRNAEGLSLPKWCQFACCFYLGLVMG
jgi:hypothetical protein